MNINIKKGIASQVSLPINKAGFTLVEMMVTVAIAAILAGIGIPNLQRTLQDNQMTSRYNEFLSSLNLTRNTAITQGAPAALCKRNASGSGCAANSADWQYGWLVFSDKNNNGTVDAGEKILQDKSDINGNVTMHYSRVINRISYSAEGYAYGFAGTFTFCDQRGDSARKGMVISQNGRMRKAESGDNLSTCPP